MLTKCSILQVKLFTLNARLCLSNFFFLQLWYPLVIRHFIKLFSFLRFCPPVLKPPVYYFRATCVWCKTYTAEPKWYWLTVTADSGLRTFSFIDDMTDYWLLCDGSCASQAIGTMNSNISDYVTVLILMILNHFKWFWFHVGIYSLGLHYDMMFKKWQSIKFRRISRRPTCMDQIFDICPCLPTCCCAGRWICPMLLLLLLSSVVSGYKLNVMQWFSTRGPRAWAFKNISFIFMLSCW